MNFIIVDMTLPENERHPAADAEALTPLLDVNIEEWKIFQFSIFVNM